MRRVGESRIDSRGAPGRLPGKAAWARAATAIFSACLGAPLLLTCLTLSPVSATAPALPFHLVEHSPDPAAAHIIDGVWMRTLVPFRGRNVVALDGAPAPGVLRFSLGVLPALRGGAEFSIVFVAATGERTELYTRAVTDPGWYDDVVDLGDRDLAGARLVLRKRLLVDKQPPLVGGALWGEPVVVPRPAPRSSPSVILISVDTLRADAVGIHGAQNRTPAIDALARAGVRFSNSYSASTWTYPSHAALLRGVNAGSLPERTPRMAVEPGTVKASLAQIFRSHGYGTAGFTGGGFLSLTWGFPAGFDRYFAFEQPEHGAACRPERFDGAEVFARAGRWLEANKARPFFLFVHTYDAHDRCPVTPRGLGPFAPWPDPGAAGRKKLIDYYASLIGDVDKLVASLLAQVEALGLAKDTIVVLTSDHGEAFWEHGFYGHGCLARPYDPVTRVPLILRGPGVGTPGAVVDQPVSAIDVAPTLLALSGLAVPPDMEGKLLPGVGLAAARTAQDPVFVQCGDNLAVRIGARKLITQRSGGRDEIYDLDRDAKEEHNILGEDTDSDAALLGQAKRYWPGATAETALILKKEEKVDESTRERLRALGYVE